jgi:hypothetical protein
MSAGRQITSQPSTGRPDFAAFFRSAMPAAAYAFITTRAVIFFILLASTCLTLGPISGGVRTLRYARPPQGFVAALEHTVSGGDAAWYLAIAVSGYEHQQFNAAAPHNWAFFPAFPLLVRGGGIFGRDMVLPALVISNVLFFLALICFHMVARHLGYEADVAERAMFYLAASPAAYFFSVPLSESLFLLLTLAAFDFALRERWIAAGVAGGFASATRLTGILLVPVLGLLWWQRGGTRARSLVSLLLVPVGLLEFMLYLHVITDNAFAFRDIQRAFGREAPTLFALSPLIQYVRHPGLSNAWSLYPLDFACALVALAASAVLAMRRQWALAAYTLLSILIPLTTGSLSSIPRYMAVVFPIFLVMAEFADTPRKDAAIRTVLVASLVVMTAFYALQFGFAMA